MMKQRTQQSGTRGSRGAHLDRAGKVRAPRGPAVQARVVAICFAILIPTLSGSIAVAAAQRSNLAQKGTIAQGAPAASSPSDWPAEERRLSNKRFRDGLKQRGLTEMLALHLRTFPPDDVAAGLLIQRELMLARAVDPTSSPAQRRDALIEANRLLAELIDAVPDDPRRPDWQLTLANSRIYEEAEPYFTRILYLGGTEEDRQALKAITSDVTTRLRRLHDWIEKEFERIDNLSVREFERLDALGYIQQLDELLPRIEYLELWAYYYDALPRTDDDPRRVRDLRGVLDLLPPDSTLLTLPHHRTGVQVQLQLLVGMSHRLLNNHLEARKYLQQAIETEGRIDDADARARVDWARRLAWIELVRNAVEDQRFDQADAALMSFREKVVEASPARQGLHLVAALLERSILQGRADAASEAGDEIEARRWERQASRALITLVRQHPEQRDQVYGTLADLIEADATPDSLDPVEQCALLAQLIHRATQTSGQGRAEQQARAETLSRARAIGEYFLEHVDATAASLIPEVLYNLGVVRYRQGDPQPAAQHFMQVARDHPGYPNALSAGELAVQVLAEQYSPASWTSNRALAELYLEALNLLVTQFSATEAAHYWQFYYGQVLEEAGRFDDAAAAYAMVRESHERYLESAFFRLRSLSAALEQIALEQPGESARIYRRGTELIDLQRSFETLVVAAIEEAPTKARKQQLERMRARALIFVAEIHVLAAIDRPARALELLDNYENTHPTDPDLVSRVLRSRLLAYEQLGRFEEATRALPAYIAADPEHAGATMQSLYRALATDVRRLEEAGQAQAAKRKAGSALLLAKELVQWAKAHPQAMGTTELDALQRQLGEAHLAAGNFHEAEEIFAPMVADAEAATAADPEHLPSIRLLIGYAETLYRLERYDEALLRFNQLARDLPPDEPRRWDALLRDLQCRTRLGHDPKTIIKTIDQQEYLYDLGGDRLREDFARLRRTNQQQIQKDDG
jgi:hypothetical protein